jgi:hypothetical protein
MTAAIREAVRHILSRAPAACKEFESRGKERRVGGNRSASDTFKLTDPRVRLSL